MLDLLRRTVVGRLFGLLLLAGCSSEAPPVDPGDGGAPPDPDAGVPAPLPELSLEPLGPEAGGGFGPLAVMPDAVVVVTHAGLYRSTDAGASWSWMRPPAGCEVPSWIGALGDELFAYCAETVWRSVDTGESWIRASEPSEIGPRLVVEGSHLLGMRGAIFVRWTDGGWTELPEPPGHVSNWIATDGARGYAISTRFEGEIDLASPGAEWQAMDGLGGAGYGSVHLAFGERASYAIVENGSEWIVVERDGSGPWVVTVRIPNADSPVSGVADARVIEGALYVVAANGLFVSSDGGLSFHRQIDAPFAAERSIVRAGDVLFAASAEGLYVLRGRAWERLAFFPEPMRSVRGVGDGATARRRVGEWERDVRTSGDGVWTETGLPSAWYPPVLAGDELVTLADGAVHASSDGGVTFERRSTIEDWIVFLDFVGGELIAAASATSTPFRLIASSDGGRTWSERGAYPGTYDGGPLQLARAGDAWLAKKWSGALLRSTDDLASWQEVDVAELGGLGSIVGSGDTAFAILVEGGVARSIDGGATWERAGLADLPVSSVIAHGGAWLAGVGAVDRPEGGVRVSYDLGTTWIELSTASGSPSLADVRITSLASDGGRLLAGTFDRGVWRSELRR